MAIGITTHVLDISRGRPAAGVPVVLEVQDGGWQEAGRARPDDKGRATLLNDPPKPGIWRLTFDLASWFESQGIESFYPAAAIVFRVRDAEPHYHVPLLLSPFGYSTYRGS